MRAVTWQGFEDVQVQALPDPRIEEPTDAIVEVTSTAICGSDLHLYRPLAMFMEPGDVLGHEVMGRVVAVGSEVTHIAPGDRVVVPFNISCGRCHMCDLQLFAQCETTQVREHGKGAALFGYTKLYGHVPGGQADLVAPQAHFARSRSPGGPPDDRYCSCPTLPTAWQAGHGRAPVGRWPSSASVRSARWPAGSPGSRASRRSSASTSCPSGSPWPSATAPRPSTPAGSTTSPRPSGRSPAGAARTR